MSLKFKKYSSFLNLQKSRSNLKVKRYGSNLTFNKSESGIFDNIAFLNTEILGINDYDASVTTNMSVMMTAEELTISQLIPEITRQYIISIDKDSISLNEFNSIVRTDYVANPNVDGILISDKNIDIIVNTTVNLNTENINMVAQIPSIAVGSVDIMPVSSVRIIEYDPTVNTNFVEQLAMQNISINQLNPTGYTHTKSEIQKFSVSINDYNVTHSSNANISVDRESLFVNDIGLNVSTNLLYTVPSPEQMIFTQQNVSVLLSSINNIDLISLSLLNDTPSIITSSVNLVGNESIIISDNNVNTVLSTNISVTSDSVGINEYAVTILTEEAPSGGAPTVIAGTSVHTNGATGTTETFAYDSGAGSNRCLIVAVGAENGKNGVSSISYGGQNMTLLDYYPHPNPAGTFMEETRIYYLLDPPTGSNSFSITFNNDSFDYSVQLTTFENVNQSTPFGTPVNVLYEEPDTTATVDVTTTGTDSAIFVFGVINGTGCAPFTMIAETTELSQGAQPVAVNLGFVYYTGFRGALETTGTYTVGANSDSAVDGAPSDTLVTGVEIFGT